MLTSRRVSLTKKWIPNAKLTESYHNLPHYQAHLIMMTIISVLFLKVHIVVMKIKIMKPESSFCAGCPSLKKEKDSASSGLCVPLSFSCMLELSVCVNIWERTIWCTNYSHTHTPCTDRCSLDLVELWSLHPCVYTLMSNPFTYLKFSVFSFRKISLELHVLPHVLDPIQL